MLSIEERLTTWLPAPGPATGRVLSSWVNISALHSAPQGKERSEHNQFTIDTGITVYFAHPGSPWERGTNEHTNGLLRQFVPKGTECGQVSTREITWVQRDLNDRPRALLHWQKSTEIIHHLVALHV